jgi:hypothetical protein
MKKPLQVFCCYAREDQPFLLTLKKHLRPLQRQDLIDVWYDRDINVGTEWAHEINEHLSHAQMILLLVSPAFMDSEYCYSIKMRRAMERHERGEAYVIPIILRPIIWDEAPFGKLQVLPTDAEPVSSKAWYTEDHAFFDIARGIQKMTKEFITRSQAEETQQVQVTHVNKTGEDATDRGRTNSIIELLQPLTKTPQCTWVVQWPDGYKITNVELKYDDQSEASTDHYKYTMRDDIQQAIDDWGTKNEDNAQLKALRMRLEEQAEAIQVRVKKMGWRHYMKDMSKPVYKYVIWLEPTRYLYYDAIHGNLGRNAQLKHLRERYFRNAFIDLDKSVPLELPSDFALHTAVVSRDGYLILRQRTGYTEHYPLAWEVGVGEFMHGPGPLDMPDVDVPSDPGRSELRHFRKNRTPDLSLFLKNAVAEELGYREARQGDFRLYGFAVEHETLAPKLLGVYNSDCTRDMLLQSAKGEKVKDPARKLSSLELTPQAIAEAFSSSQYPSWEPKSKLVILLALKQDLEAKGMKDQSLEVEKLMDYFKPDTLPGKEPDDPWKLHE